MRWLFLLATALSRSETMSYTAHLPGAPRPEGGLSLRDHSDQAETYSAADESNKY